MKYRLKVNQPNKLFVLRGKAVRSPFVLDNVTESELKMFKAKIKLEGLTKDDYELINMEDVGKEKAAPKTSSNNANSEENNEQEEIEEDESKLTLDKYEEEE